eukprot:6382519-Prymnesium_polylepis.1
MTSPRHGWGGPWLAVILEDKRGICLTTLCTPSSVFPPPLPLPPIPAPLLERRDSLALELTCLTRVSSRPCRLWRV